MKNEEIEKKEVKIKEKGEKVKERMKVVEIEVREK